MNASSHASACTAPAFWSRVAAPSTSYEPRCPAQGALYQIVHDHFETLRAQAASLRDGEGVPRFVEAEFRNFLQCGWLAGGFAQFAAGTAASTCSSHFRVKGRALCPVHSDLSPLTNPALQSAEKPQPSTAKPETEECGHGP